MKSKRIIKKQLMKISHFFWILVQQICCENQTNEHGVQEAEGLNLQAHGCSVTTAAQIKIRSAGLDTTSLDVSTTEQLMANWTDR